MKKYGINPSLLTGAWYCLACLFFIACTEPATQTPPNIVLIMADDLGYGDLSCYGNPSIQTPNIDQLAAEGIRFRDYHSNGAVCSPTRAALLSGMYQQRVGIPGVVYTRLRDSLGMSTSVETLAEVFQDSGYATGIIGKWHLGYKTEFNPVRQGFDEFKGFVAGNVDYHSHLDNLLIHDWWTNEEIIAETGYSTDLITQYATNFIERNAEQPFFLYVPHAAPHDPYEGRSDPPIRLKGKDNRTVAADDLPGIYKEMVEVMDEGVGEIMQLLEAKGLSENTIVIFCSDNGANKRGSNGLLRGYKAGLFEGGHRVPAIVRWPGKIVAGQTSDETVLSMDFFPTLCEMAGIPLEDRVLDGQSIAGHLLEGTPLPERTLFWEYEGKQAVRKGNWKWIRQGNTTGLYDLESDIGEQSSLIEQLPGLATEMEEAFVEWEEGL